MWRYLPLTRTEHKRLTCSFATPQLSPALCVAPRPNAKHTWRLRRRLDERDITELITAYCEGTVAAFLAAAHVPRRSDRSRPSDPFRDHRGWHRGYTAAAHESTALSRPQWNLSESARTLGRLQGRRRPKRDPRNTHRPSNRLDRQSLRSAQRRISTQFSMDHTLRPPSFGASQGQQTEE